MRRDPGPRRGRGPIHGHPCYPAPLAETTCRSAAAPIPRSIGTPRRPSAVKLGAFEQIIEPHTRRATSVVTFNVLGGVRGRFAIDAEFDLVSDRRVSVRSVGRSLEPSALQELLGENIELLSEIFSPDGWLDITYVDEQLRIGRDKNGLVFVLEKVADGEE